MEKKKEMVDQKTWPFKLFLKFWRMSDDRIVAGIVCSTCKYGSFVAGKLCDFLLTRALDVIHEYNTNSRLLYFFYFNVQVQKQ